jgi:acetyl esterase
MPLDPNVKLMLDAMRAANMNPFEDNILAKTAGELRAALAANRVPAPEVPIARYEDRTFAGHDGAPVPVRIFWPDTDPAPKPAVVFFHGGGWVIGGLDTHEGSARQLANATGAVVVFVDYRLAPEAQFPVPAEDCYAGLVWTVEQSAALGIDPNRIAVAGDSAGGNLAAVVALMARDRKGPALRHQLLIYPCTDMQPDRWPSMSENENGFFLTTDSMVWFYDQYAPEAADRTNPYASPIHATDLSGLPPAFVITAEFDPLRDEGEAYAARLAAAGVPCDVQRYDGMIHGFFGMSAMFEQARTANAVAAEKLKAALA